jgi:predicted nucleotidyltransferase
MRSVYGPRLRGVYLYGQRASEDAPPDAEVDLLIVLDRIDSYGAELEQTSTICALLSLEARVIVSRVFVSEADWLGRVEGPLAQARAEAVPL